MTRLIGMVNSGELRSLKRPAPSLSKKMTGASPLDWQPQSATTDRNITRGGALGIAGRVVAGVKAGRWWPAGCLPVA